MRRLVALRLLLVVPLLIATLVLHLSGTDVVILRIARILLLAALVGGLAYLRRRKRPGEPPDRDDELGAPAKRDDEHVADDVVGRRPLGPAQHVRPYGSTVVRK